MGRTVTWILVGAIGVLGALAVADALRPAPGARSAAPSTTTTRPKPPTLAETLRTEAVTGFVVYADDGCVLHSLRLPLMVDDVIRDDGGEPVRFCRFDMVGGQIAPERGRQDENRPTVHRDGIYVQDRRLLTEQDLVRAARRDPNVSRERPGSIRLQVKDVVRTRSHELVVTMRITARSMPPQFLAGVFLDRALAGIGAGFRGPFGQLFTSSTGPFAAAGDGTVFMPNGRTVDPPQGLPVGRTVAFSPDNRWIARVNGISIFLIATPLNEEPTRIIRLPVPARDLVWRPVTSGTSIGPPIRR